MTPETRIAELEAALLKQQELGLRHWQSEKSRLGNIYDDNLQPVSDSESPYIETLVENEAYRRFCFDNKVLQDYWRHPMYLRELSNGYGKVSSNIFIGDFFCCGDSKQFAVVYHKLSVIQCGLKPEDWKPSPAGPGGCYLRYRIGGNIGGHWCEPDHDDFTATGHFKWLPTPIRLIAAGFRVEGEELMRIAIAGIDRNSEAQQ